MVFFKQIKISGFKTYGTQSMITFDSKFNVLIGPPDSGKSNIFDAISFGLNSSILDQKDIKSSLYQGKKRKEKENFIEITLGIEPEKLANQFSETVIKKLFGKNGEYSFTCDSRPINQLELAKNFNLPKVTDIQDLCIVTNVKLEGILSLYLKEKEEFINNLVRNRNTVFNIDNSLVNEFSPTKELEQLISNTYTEITSKTLGKIYFDSEMLTGPDRYILGICLLISLSELFKFPFLLLDDIDTTLDSEIVHNLSNKLLELTHIGTQVIIITNREIMMAKATSIWGVSKKNDQTQLWQMALDNTRKS